MNVLVLYNSNLFPTTRANQQRICQTILSLSEYHHVHVVCFYHNEEQRLETSNRLGHNTTLHLFPAVPSSVRARGIDLRNKILRKLGIAPKGRRNSKDYYRKDIIRILTETTYEAVISEYWHWAHLFDRLPSSTIKIIDTHNVNFQKKALKANHVTGIRRRLKDRKLKRLLLMQALQDSEQFFLQQ